MRLPVILVACLGLILTSAGVCRADQIKAYLAGFVATGAQNKDELQAVLQSMLLSRLNGERVAVVPTAEEADISVTGSYVAFGKSFSLDVVAKSRTGGVVTSAFVQGEKEEELIPALGKLAQDLTAGIVKGYRPQPVAAPARRSAAGGIEMINASGLEKSPAQPWISQRIPLVMTAIAEGSALGDGGQELFIAGDHVLQLYRQGKQLQLLAETTLPRELKILTIDSADLDSDGAPELYVTLWNGSALVSQVYVTADDKLKLLADKLPYFFRAIALKGGKKKIFTQEMNSDNDFYGDVCELVKTGAAYRTRNPMKLPRYGNLFNFNTFTDAQGRDHFLILNGDGYLVVYSGDREELWRSNDKFGGSENSFQRPDDSKVRITGETTRSIFLEQRIVVTSDGTIMVPHHSGSLVIGNSRSYSKSSLYGFAWNGASLEQKWRTSESQNYLADYSYDEGQNELLLLEVVKKEGLLGKGASAVSVRKVE